MKRIILLLILSIIVEFTAKCQVISGTIIDKSNGNAITNAIVYFNGTFASTQSDQHGHFKLDISNYSLMPLIISALGYSSITLTTYSTNKELLIYLTPKVFELKEFVVSAKLDTKARKANLKLLRKQFLGNTSNALKCEIINEDDISFSYDTAHKTLKAFSSKPILIDNKALGYKISYFLDRFEYCKTNNSLLITGNYIFQEDKPKNKNQYNTFERKRKTAYLGSRMHFFRALWANNLAPEGFVIKNELDYESLVYSTDSCNTANHSKFLKNNPDIYITSPFNSGWGSSFVKILKDSVSFDKNGYFDPFGISWEGEMAKQRIADLLPFEYTTK